MPEVPSDSFATWLWELATFRRFVSPSLLVVFYYLGALLAPIIGLFILRQLTRRADQIEVPGEIMGRDVRPLWSRSVTAMRVMAVLAFVFFELFWRMMFEFLLAYFQMRDALLVLGAN